MEKDQLEVSALVKLPDSNSTTNIDSLDTLDNNLPTVGNVNFPSKLARINSECADPALHEDCLPGQKWKCINEDGRWRKHKCKFHVSNTNNISYRSICLILLVADAEPYGEDNQRA